MSSSLIVSHSQYDADGNPTATAIDYQENREYFNFNQTLPYGFDGRTATFNNRGRDGKTTVLQEASPMTWFETVVKILEAEMDNKTNFDTIEMNISGFPNGDVARYNILGFTQQADDDLSVINFVHTYQIPDLR